MPAHTGEADGCSTVRQAPDEVAIYFCCFWQVLALAKSGKINSRYVLIEFYAWPPMGESIYPPNISSWLMIWSYPFSRGISSIVGNDIYCLGISNSSFYAIYLYVALHHCCVPKRNLNRFRTFAPPMILFRNLCVRTEAGTLCFNTTLKSRAYCSVLSTQAFGFQLNRSY